jgi:hypothetical protein
MGRSAIDSGTRDVRMVNRLRHLLESEGRIPRFDVDVDVENGVVELLGVIPDQKEHDALMALVAFAVHSRPVRDHIVVTRPSKRKPEKVASRR